MWPTEDGSAVTVQSTALSGELSITGRQETRRPVKRSRNRVDRRQPGWSGAPGQSRTHGLRIRRRSAVVKTRIYQALCPRGRSLRWLHGTLMTVASHHVDPPSAAGSGPQDGSDTAWTACPARRSSAATAFQHQGPANEPWTRTNRAIAHHPLARRSSIDVSSRAPLAARSDVAGSRAWRSRAPKSFGPSWGTASRPHPGIARPGVASIRRSLRNASSCSPVKRLFSSSDARSERARGTARPGIPRHSATRVSWRRVLG